jgi:hypothetical protein
LHFLFQFEGNSDLVPPGCFACHLCGSYVFGVVGEVVTMGCSLENQESRQPS